jgi:hypothetical protein
VFFEPLLAPDEFLFESQSARYRLEAKEPVHVILQKSRGTWQRPEIVHLRSVATWHIYYVHKMHNVESYV